MMCVGGGTHMLMELLGGLHYHGTVVPSLLDGVLRYER